MIQLVKHKKYKRVFTVYIPMYYEVGIRSTYGRHKVCWVKNMPYQWDTDWATVQLRKYQWKK